VDKSSWIKSIQSLGAGLQYIHGWKYRTKFIETKKTVDQSRAW
jgi:hypothetical protein